MTYRNADAASCHSRKTQFRVTLLGMSRETHHSLRNDEHRLERRDPERRHDALAHSHESFDRMGFAMALVRWFRPQNLTVVFHESYAGVRVERGRDYARGGSWVMLGIAPGASRERIALAVAEVLGLERVPFVVDLLVQAGRAMATGESVEQLRHLLFPAGAR